MKMAVHSVCTCYIPCLYEIGLVLGTFTSVRADLIVVDFFLTEDVRSSPWQRRQYAPLERRSSSTRLRRAEYQKAVILTLAAVKT
jgi:hypothetical protein